MPLPIGRKRGGQNRFSRIGVRSRNQQGVRGSFHGYLTSTLRMNGDFALTSMM